MNKNDNVIHPQYASAPGETLAESLEVLGMTPNALAVATSSSPAYVSAVLRGTDRVTPAFAEALTQVVEVEATFWLRMDQAYWSFKMSGRIDEM